MKRFLQTLHLRFSPPLVFNDPFEIRPVIGSVVERKQNKLRGMRAEGLYDLDFPMSLRSYLNLGIGINVGVLCLTEDSGNTLMWAHYADCHRGVTIGFDAEHAFFASPKSPADFLQFLTPIFYSQHRSVLSLEFFRKYQAEEIARTGWLELLRHQDPLFFTKSLDWQYEREWRLVRQLLPVPDTPEDWAGRIMNAKYSPHTIRPEQLISIPPEAIQNITLGHKSRRVESDDGDVLEEEIIRILEGNPKLSHIKLWRAKLHAESFSVTRFCLDSMQDLKKNVHPQELTFRLYGYLGRSPRK